MEDNIEYLNHEIVEHTLRTREWAAMHQNGEKIVDHCLKKT